jgi:hypothetical protein
MDRGRLSADAAIAGALMAYACGDALGVPWEGQPPGTADPARAVEIPLARVATGQHVR